MVDFGGWELPQQYTSIRDEHLAVRKVAGLFDISHMGRLLVEGAGAMGVAAAIKLQDTLQGQRVGVVFCGGNMDSAVLRRILNREL